MKKTYTLFFLLAFAFSALKAQVGPATFMLFTNFNEDGIAKALFDDFWPLASYYAWSLSLF